jgi:uncharacterized protein YdaU (DUF1376 family)
MSKDPAFLIYPNDYLGGTMGFSVLQHGSYFIALMFQFNTGHFSDEAITAIVGSDNWQSVQHKFKKDTMGLRYNQRLEEEVQKRQNFSASRRKNIGKRWGKNNKPLSGNKIDNIHMNNTCNTSVIHMGNGNGNGNRSKKIFIPPTIEEVKKYFLENGYSPELAERFFKGYAAADWKDSKGDQVKNWKQKAQHVWFKPESKIQSSTPKVTPFAYRPLV